MKKIYLVLFLFTGLLFKAQTICNTSGNLMLFTNYDGGTLTINVDQNIPNLKIGICSYEGVAIYLTGAFVGNVTAIRYAGFNSSNNHCGSSINTNFNGVPVTAVTSSAVAPAVTLANSNGYSSIICGYSCSNSTNQGGCNTVDQIEAYFLNYFSGSVLFAHKVQYGCWTGTQSVSIGGTCCPPPPVYPGVIAASQTICAGSTPSAFLSSSSATVSSGTIGYQWQSSTTSPSSGFTNIVGAIGATYGPAALTQTTYYRRAASTATNNVVYSNVLTITVLPLPLLSISGSTLVCSGSSLALTATGGTSYAWSTGNITASIILTPTVNTILSVTCFPANGCSVVASQAISVNALPIIIGVSSNPYQDCVGDSVILTGIGGVTYTWSPGNLTGQTVTVTPTTTTIFTLVGQDQNGCIKVTTVYNQVNPLPIVAIGINPNLVCTGKTVTLSALGTMFYTWMPGSLTGPSITLTPVASIIYTVTGSDGFCNNTATVSLNALPSPTVLLSANRSKICPGETSVITTTGAVSYTLENTSSPVSANTLVVSPTITTNYTVTGLASNGCRESAVKTITVSNCTGIETNISTEGDKIWIYPNPSNGAFTLRTDKFAEIRINNSMGQLVKTIQLSEKNNYEILITDLSEGIYFVGSVQSGTRQKISITHQ